MKKHVATVLITAAVILAAGTALAGTDLSKVFHNRVGTSHIQIDVQPMRQTENGLESISTDLLTMPGEKCSYIPRVTVTGRDSYVRIRFRGTMDDGTSLSAEDVYGLSVNWIRKGDDFYCRKVLKTGEYEDVFQGIRIPQTESGVGLAGFRIWITADAVQSSHFAPDFASEQPWGSVSIQSSSASGPVESRTASIIENDTLDLLDNNYIECASDDLFANFATMVAGDSGSDQLVLRNRSSEKRKVLFRTDNSERELLKEIRLQIRCGDFAYAGTLDSRDLQQPVTVATLEPGEEATFRYDIQLPEEADNRFQSIRDHILWIFETKAVGTPAKATADTDDYANDNENAVRTGDDKWRIAGLAGLLCLLSALAIVRMIRRKNNEKDNGLDH